jgi:hypothetical protein
MNPPVPAVQLDPAVGSVVGHIGGGVMQAHASIPPAPRRQVQFVVPYVQARFVVMHVDMFMGCVAGHVPQDHMAAPPAPPTQRQSVVP